MSKIKDKKASEISDEEIKEEFGKAELIDFDASGYNWVEHRSIGIPVFSSWIPLKRFLEILEITPQMLRPVFHPQLHYKNIPGGGFEPDLPETIETYEQLMAFETNEANFQKLSDILKKPIRVSRKDGIEGINSILFTVYPNSS